MEPYSTFTVGLALLASVGLFYLISFAQDTPTAQNSKARKPPVLPFSVPLVGHLFQFLWNTQKLLSKTSRIHYGPDTPVQIKLLNRRITMLNGAENITALFKSSRSVNSERWLIQVLVNAFGVRKVDVPFYVADNTGIAQQPAANSHNIPYEHRIFHLVYQTVHDGLSGERLDEMQRQLVLNLSTQIANAEIGGTWTHVDNLYEDLIRSFCFKASTTSLCGPRIFEAAPDLESDFWSFDSHLPNLFKEMPQWLVPASFKARDKMKENIRKWHELAHKAYDITQSEEDTRTWEENFGSKLMRSRQAFFRKMPLSKDTIAADDLGLLWAATANAVPAIGWMILETVQRPGLLELVRAEIAPFISFASNTTTPDIDIDELCQQPLVQSIYAEVLRVHNGTVLARVPQVSDYSIAGWSFPKDQHIMISTYDTARKLSVWNQGTSDDPHPVNEFWPERFIVDPNNPASGPAVHRESKQQGTGEKYFTLDGTVGSWIPYGGGSRMCPGRHFAKKELIVSMAMFLTSFDIELEALDGWIQDDPKYFMFGVMHPQGPIRARVRRRIFDA
ncbi:hypothetical protein BFJ72_g3154 [Fusarium proliferatum]|uniref:Cytochrome P450 n=1 Tax=Gibberella intermedia TaxID=948311 RepID=A0A420TVN6_GIBIN|nr:hypothetical protein BFJ72_g3154 [Fusarium proliferatum]